MIHQRVVFVVGAGASKEFGLPIGEELGGLIAKRCDLQSNLAGGFSGEGDFDLTNLNLPREDLVRAARLLRQGVPTSRSIDEFLEIHEADPAVRVLGKAAIVKQILQSEFESSLSAPGNPEGELDLLQESITSTWLAKLYRLMSAGVRAGDVESLFRNVTFITFNYDRTIEQFLFHAITHQHGASATPADIRKHAKVYHVYGSVGALDKMPGNDRVWYGATFSMGYAQLTRLADHIRLYTDSFKDAVLHKQITNSLRDADMVIFLGFAFHQQNMTLLGLDSEATTSVKHIFGTTYGMPAATNSFIRPPLIQLLNEQIRFYGSEINIQLQPFTCARMIDECALNLTRS